MWRDPLLKMRWRVFVVILYIVMGGSIVLRIFPITEGFRSILNMLTVWASVCFIIFAWIYYKKPELLREEDLDN
jgi:predicted membrane channel-forming protein YqfA (hemolysin III family)